MADLGNLLGSLMSNIVQARRMADEQTAALAEYYKDNPLLEGLTVPRIRIPELTIDLPLLIEDHVDGAFGKMNTPEKIAAIAREELKATAAKNAIKINAATQKDFENEVKRRLVALEQSGVIIMKETVVRSVQDAFSDVLSRTDTKLTSKDREIIAKNLRAKIGPVSLAKEPVASSIVGNIKTSDVKERATPTSVVRLKVTFKEEGLEWATHARESGGTVRTLQPE